MSYESTIKTDGLDDFNPFTNQPYGTAPSRPYDNAARNTNNDESGEPKRKSLYDSFKKKDENSETIRLVETIDKGDSRKNSQSSVNMRNNFPPCYPCFYHDIEMDIAPELQNLAKTAYYGWLAYIIILALNLLCSFVYLLTVSSNGTWQAGSTFGTSLLWFFFLVPLSLFCWYRPLYKALKNDSSFNYMLFFFVFMGQIIICVIQSLGINWIVAACGFINGLTMLKDNKAVGATMIFIGCLFALITLVFVQLLIRVHRFYRGSGGSMNKAKEEMAQTAATNASKNGSFLNTAGGYMAGSFFKKSDPSSEK